jgi:angiopoietin 2
MMLLLGAALIDDGLGDSFSDNTVCCKAYSNLVNTAINYVINANSNCGGGSSTAAPTATTASPAATTAAPTGSFDDDTLCCKAYSNLVNTAINQVINANANCGSASTTAPPTTTSAPTTPIDPCASSPCQHGGTCVANGTSYTCDCPALFTTTTGNNCQYFYCDYLAQQGGGNTDVIITKLGGHQGYCENAATTTYFVFQRRVNCGVGFNVNWANYENGFGNPSAEYWFGNSYLSQLTSYTQWILHIDLTDKSGAQTYAAYSNFKVGGPATNYQLTSLGTYSGTAVDGLSYSLGMAFSTPDADHDNCTCNCAKAWEGGWWFNDCHRGYLNGVYGSSSPSLGINWVPTDTPSNSPSYAYSYPKASMKMRPAI